MVIKKARVYSVFKINYIQNNQLFVISIRKIEVLIFVGEKKNRIVVKEQFVVVVVLTIVIHYAYTLYAQD